MKRKSPPAAISETPPQAVRENAATPENRAAPRPFNLHLFTTACMLTAAAMPYAADPQQREKVLTLVRGMAAQMMLGLDAYRANPAKADRRAHASVWQDGSSRLLHITPDAAKNAAQVLLLPSLINRPDILDLDAQHSFAQFLKGQGYNVYMLDWGPPGAPEAAFSINDYITARFYPVLQRLNRPHVIGYCMGGTIAAGAISALDGHRDLLRSLTLLAAPWDFHAGDKGVAARMQAFTMAAEPVMAATGRLPVDWIQALFASIDPLFAFNKFKTMAGLDPDSRAARHFVIVEDWLNDGVDLAAPAARQALLEWYVENQPHNGVWNIGPRMVDAAAIKIPTLVVAAENDKLVPSASALSIMQHIDAASKLTPSVGHIGMMASARAHDEVWLPIAAWLKDKN